MRLTLINLFYPPDQSPTAHLCAAFAEHRAQLGDDVTVLTSGAGYTRVGSSPAENRGVRIRRLRSTRFGSHTRLGRFLDWATFYLPACWAAVNLPPQDVIVAMTTPPFIAMAAWLHKLSHPRCRFILWNMDVYPEALERTGLIRRGGVASRLMRSMYRAIFRRLDHLICLDDAMSELLLAQYSSEEMPTPCTIVPNWESAKLFPAMSDRCAAADTFTVLYLGNAGYGHEIKTTLAAAELLRKEPVTFLFIGGGTLWPEIARQRDMRNLKNIVLRDHVPKSQTPEVMRQAGCALITLEDAMLGVMSPSKLHANLAMGLPILYVGPRKSNVDEAINRFACGIGLRPGEPERMAEAIREMMRSPARRADLGANARRAFGSAYNDCKTLPLLDAVIAAGRSHRGEETVDDDCRSFD